MSLRVDLEKSLEGLRATLQRLDTDIRRLEDMVEDHFSLNSQKAPAKVMADLAKQIMSDVKP